MTEERMIGHYRVIEKLGSGAMGAVHVAVDTFIDRPVAIKSLRPELTHDPDFVSRFRGEAKSLARLNHPNIATLYSTLVDDADLYMIMELVRGKGLDDVMRERGKALGVKESLAIMAQAADGLSYAHEIGVIHRDIKPGNLMIANDGRVKIMDFGIARVRGSQRLTRTGTAVGTPLYMSPEQCRGGEGDERSDIYSLAVVLYEMLAGATPFSAETEYDLVQAQINSPPPPLVPRVLGVSPQLEGAIMTALAKKPDQRFQSMRAFSDALGATALRPDATAIVRNATHLVDAPLADAAEQPAPTRGVDIARSRFAGLMRWWRALPPALQGAGIATAVVALAAPAFFALSRPNAPASASRAVSPPLEETHATQGVKGGDVSAKLGGFRTALKGDAGVRIKASDFDRVSDSAKAPLLPAARSLADEGVAEAQFALGMLLLETPGLQDAEGAFEAFTRAARQDYPDAQANLGILYQKGLLKSGRDWKKAAEWFARAAANGDAKAQFWLGCYYQNGWGGLTKDPHRAEAEFSLAANVYPLAQSALKAVSGGGGESPCSN
jgi:serine/threonine-protein kinase